MSLSTGHPELSDDDLSAPKPVTYQYDLRLEIGVKNEGSIVPVQLIFRDLVKRMKAAADEGAPLAVLTATDKMYFENKELSSEDFQKEFQVDNSAGKVSKVLLGFKIRTMTKLSEIKRRLLHTFLIPHHLFIRQQVGGFANGVKTYSYGFLKDDHPDHPDISMLNQRFARITSEAWKKLDKDDRKKWRQELPNVFFGDSGIMIPINFMKDRVIASAEDKGKISTNALIVSTPTKYGKLLKTLLDIALTNKRLNNLIPFALNRDNPAGYYYIVAQQSRFIENHRNIPILNVTPEAVVKTGIKGETLMQVLTGNPAIQRVAYDPQQSKYHVSTIASKYKEVHQWISRAINDNKFPYAPTVRPMKYGIGGSNSTVMSYTDIFKDAISVANESYAESTIKTTQSNVWKNRPPIAISYSLTDAAFPPLPSSPKQPTPITPSTASETFDEDTIQSAISVAIKKLEDQHRAELTKLKMEMQSKIDEVTIQMRELGEQVAIQTYQALLKEESPLATKTDHARLQHEMTMISTQLSTIINMFQSSPNIQQSETPSQFGESNFSIGRTTPTSPSRTGKRPKPSTTPEKLLSKTTEVLTQDCSVSSATSISEESMEGCED